MVSQSRATTVGCLRYGIITQYIAEGQDNRFGRGVRLGTSASLSANELGAVLNHHPPHSC